MTTHASFWKRKALGIGFTGKSYGDSKRLETTPKDLEVTSTVCKLRNQLTSLVKAEPPKNMAFVTQNL